jgi:hypothetical protein
VDGVWVISLGPANVMEIQNTIKETFSLASVPREAMYVGLAGVVPYLLTSLTTVYLSFDIQYAATHGQGFFMSGELAESLLHIIEPIQLGYGASVRLAGKTLGEKS